MSLGQVTPLTFRRAGAGTGGRHPVPHKVTHRRLDSGYEMVGNLYSLGYFSATFCVGTPSQSFDLIIDTGSSLTAMPCTGCTHCGTHTHENVEHPYSQARYDASASTTYVDVDCHTASHCRTCSSSGECGYSVSYTEGSTIRGHMVTDTAWFAEDGGAARTGVPCRFGCQTYESGLFYSQEADGISGFSQSQSYGPTLFDSLRDATGAANLFSICLDDYYGALVMGGAVSAEAQSAVQWVPYTGGSSYSVSLADISLDGTSLGYTAHDFGTTIVDSGTSFMYLPPTPYNAVVTRWRTVCPWGACSQKATAGEYPDDYCYEMDAATLDTFAPMSFTFANGVALHVAPRDYAYELFQHGQSAVFGRAELAKPASSLGYLWLWAAPRSLEEPPSYSACPERPRCRRQAVPKSLISRRSTIRLFLGVWCMGIFDNGGRPC